MEFFTCKKIQPTVTSIYDLTRVFAYLIEGTECAALLDTGSGFGNLKALVEGLTTKPVTVICTHDHVDHAGGAYGFETVYLNEKDYDLAKAMNPGYIRLDGKLGNIVYNPQKIRRG